MRAQFTILSIAFLLAGPCLAQGLPPFGAPANPAVPPPPAAGQPPPFAPNLPPPAFPPTLQQPAFAPPPAAPPGGPPPRYGFDAPAQSPTPPPATPERQNYADELTDFHVPPQTTLQENVGSETPTTIPGGHVITTIEIRRVVGSDIPLIDVLAGPPHATLPGAITLPGAGSPGSFDDQTQQRLWTALAQISNRNPNRPLIFFCYSSRCWESYNAALRALNMGFKTVLWYRGGLMAWQASGGQMVQPGGQGGTPQHQGGIGFSQ